MCTHSLLYVCTHAYTQIHKISECQSWTLFWSLLLPISFWKPFLTSGRSLFCEELSVVWGGSRQQDTYDGWRTFSYKLRSASRSCAHSSRCVPCSRIQGSPSPSSSHLVETVTPAPPALLSWRHLHTPGQGLGSVPRVVFSLAECTVLGNLKRRYSEASSKITPRRQKYPLSAPSGLKSDYWEVVSRMRVATKFLS